MAELAGAGLEAGAPMGADAVASGAGKGAGVAGDALGAGAGSFAGDAGSFLGDAAGFAGDAAGASPWIVELPFTSAVGGGFDYLGAAGAGAADAASGAGGFFGGGSDLLVDGAAAPTAFAGDAASAIAPDAGMITSDAALTTPGATTPSFGSGSALPGSTVSGQPFAAGGTTAVGPGASIDPAGVGGVAAAPSPSGPSAASLAAGPTPSGASPADQTSSWGDALKKGLTNNPLGAAIGAGGLAYNILSGQKQTANQGALTQAAQQQAGQSAKLADAGIAQVGTNQANANDIGARGKDLEQYLATGQLPAQYSQQVDQAIQDAKTTAISNAAKNGQPTDPTKNTSLAQSLAQIDGQRASMTSKVAETLFQAGAGLTNTSASIGNASASSLLSGGQNAANLSGQLYTTLTGIDSKQSEQTAKAIANLAASLNGGGDQKNQQQKAA